MRPLALLVCLVLSACGGRGGGGDDDDDVAGDGDADGDGTPDLRCLDAAGQPTDNCALEPDRQPCELDETESCAPVTLEEVWADDGENGTCLHIVAENGCDDTLYSWTCMEHLEPDVDPGTSWQCWLSTTLPGGDVDVSQCDATGRWAHYGSLSDGTLDIIDDRCNPRP